MSTILHKLFYYKAVLYMRWHQKGRLSATKKYNDYVLQVFSFRPNSSSLVLKYDLLYCDLAFDVRRRLQTLTFAAMSIRTLAAAFRLPPPFRMLVAYLAMKAADA